MRTNQSKGDSEVPSHQEQIGVVRRCNRAHRTGISYRPGPGGPDDPASSRLRKVAVAWFSIHVGNEVVGQYDVTMATSQDKVVGRPVKQDHAEVITGNPYGGMTGSTIDFTINWDQGPRTPYSSHYTGQINDEGLANGIVHTGNRDDGWSSSQKFSCSTPAAPPQQAKPMATVAADVDVYDAPNINNDKEPLGILRSDQKVEVVGSAEPGQQGQTCAVNSWCTVRGPNVPNGQGVIWGHLKDFTG